jgi:hypothetical protein
MLLHACHGGETELMVWGNVLSLFRSEKEEWIVKGATTAKEIQRIVGGTSEDAMEAEGEKGAKGEEEKKRDSFERGVSIECGKKSFI